MKLRVNIRQNSERNVRVIVNTSGVRSKIALQRVFDKLGDEILTSLANRMAMLLIDIPIPVYTGRYFARKFGGLFKNPRLKILKYDISKKEPYGWMEKHGKIVPASKRAQIIGREWLYSSANLFMKRINMGDKMSLMIKYTIPSTFELGLPYANKIENTGWRKTPPYNISAILKFFRVESLERRNILLLIRRMALDRDIGDFNV